MSEPGRDRLRNGGFGGKDVMATQEFGVEFGRDECKWHC